MTAFIEKLVGSLEDKRRWRDYKRRVQAMPPPYRSTTEAVGLYLLHRGAITQGEVLVQMLHDLADLFDGAAADGTPVRTVVGEDPVGFAETFLENYAEARWIVKEQRRLVDAVDRAVREQS